MTDKKITQLDSGSSLAPSDILIFVSGSTTSPINKFIRADQLFGNVQTNINTIGNVNLSGCVISNSGSITLNNQTNVNGNLTATDIYTIPFTNYSGSTNTYGWSATPTKKVYYKKIGKTVFVQFNISGSSNDALSSFTVPYSVNTGMTPVIFFAKVGDSGANLANAGYGILNSGSQVYVYRDLSNASTFSASGVKYIQGQFFYETT